MRKKLIFLVGAFVFQSGYAFSANDKVAFVVGGSDARIDDAPWQAFLIAQNQSCGGVVIDAHWVLTAAHCLDSASNNAPFSEIPAHLISVYTGTATIHGTNFANHRAQVDKVYVHQQYDKFSLINDIALIKLATPVHANASSVVLANATDQRNIDASSDLSAQNLRLTGWGFTNPNRTTFSNTMQKVALSAVSDNACALAWGATVTDVSDFQNTFFCAEATDKGSCNGDSGGPLIWHDPALAAESDSGAKLVGIVSFGVASQCALNGVPDVYTQVSSYINWIDGCMSGECVGSTNTGPEVASTDGGGSTSVVVLFWLMLMAFLQRIMGSNSAAFKNLRQTTPLFNIDKIKRN